MRRGQRCNDGRRNWHQRIVTSTTKSAMSVDWKRGSRCFGAEHLPFGCCSWFAGSSRSHRAPSCALDNPATRYRVPAPARSLLGRRLEHANMLDPDRVREYVHAVTQRRVVAAAVLDDIVEQLRRADDCAHRERPAVLSIPEEPTSKQRLCEAARSAVAHPSNA